MNDVRLALRTFAIIGMVRGGMDTPRSDAFEEPDRRQSVKRIAGAEVLVGWRSGSSGAATEGPHVPPTYPRRCV